MKKTKTKNKTKAPKPLSNKVMDAVSALSYAIIHLGSDSPSAEFIFEAIQSLYKKKEIEDILELVETEVFFIYDNLGKGFNSKGLKAMNDLDKKIDKLFSKIQK